MSKNAREREAVSTDDEITTWLDGIGLAQYATIFAENAIDLDVLSDVSEADLERLGVALGHRKRMLRAIASLPGARPAAGASGTGRAPPLSEPERRQLTVLFCDLVGSTALAVKLDPEDLREVVRGYQSSCAAVVTQMGGHVARFMGDGLLVYFGYPQAHEDDAERAVRAGLAVIEAVGRLDLPAQLSVRLGIASGIVVVGDLIGAGAAQERGIVGETPNLAARLQALAEPGRLLIAENTRQQLGGLFDLEDLGPRTIAGFVEPQHIWQVLAESGLVSRFEALRSQAAPLIGRDEEMDLLLRRWAQAKAREGRVVLVSGEPGIGKSRLTAAFAESIAGERHTRLRHFCSPFHQDSALHPFILQLERAAGFARDDTAEQKRAKLDALLSPGARGPDDMTLIAELLSLPNTAADLNLSAQRKREMLLEGFLHQLEAMVRSQPVLMVFEDAHWIDPTSRELMDLTIDRLRRMPVLLIITFRSEFQPAWGGQSHVTTLALNRLGARDVATLVHSLAGNTPLGTEFVEEIIDRTDGVPLFIEELTKAVLERADQDNRVAAVLSVSPLPALAVPSTLHASLTARLDRIGAMAKEVAQIGAVLGREFSYELIEPVAQRDEAELQASLARLTDAGLLFCRGGPPHASYLFKHALVQDVAYGTLLRARRQELHARVAAVLEQHFADLVERQPELLAHHLTGAGEMERAVAQWLKAGQFAAARFAHREAIRHFDRGLALIGPMPEGPARARQEIDLQLARGLSLFTTEAFNSLAAAQAYARARELSERHGDAQQLFMAIYGEWQGMVGSGRVIAARPSSERLLRLTAGEADSGLRLQAHHSAWTTNWFAGRPADGREHCEEGRRLYHPEQHRTHRFLFGGHDPGTCAGNVAGLTWWLLGYPDTGLARSSEALALAERIAHPLSLELVFLLRAMLHLDRREPEPALRLIGAAEELVAEQRLAFLIEPRFFRGAALIGQGADEEAVACLREGLSTDTGRGNCRVYGLAGFAEALTHHGEHGPALAAVREGVETQQATGQQNWEPELYRVRGVALLGLNEREDSEKSLQEALGAARRRRMKSYELRAAMNLARFWGEQGRRAEAHELLAPVYGWFTEGFDTADLKEAKALLDALT